jgi:acetolactate synthase I/II/III large subunit
MADPNPIKVVSQAERSGASAIAETLLASGVEVVFGYSGGGTSVLIDQLVRSGMKMMNARTELAAAWMSYGYNRIWRRPASACLFHCVGALHASPVVYAAKVDGTPFMMMDVNLDSALDMREGLQDAGELYSALKPLTKYIRKVVSAEDLPLAVRQALLAAGTGRPGPSVLDLAFQCLTASTDCRVEGLKFPESPAASPQALKQASELMAESRSPVLIAGAGVHLAGGANALLAFAEAAHVPIVSTSWGGRGLCSDEHPLFAGVLGSFGWTCANDLAQRADLWIAVGTSFSQMTTAAWNLEKPAKTIQIDIDPAQLGKIFQPTLGIVADARIALEQLAERVLSRTNDKALAEARLVTMRAAKADWLEYQAQLGAEGGLPINQYHLIRKMGEALPAGAIVVGDSGGHAFMLYRVFKYLGMTPMASGSRYMSLGSSLPLALGAKLAAPERTVVSYHGDGGFYYDLVELSIAAQYGIKVIVVIDDNGCLLANRSGMRLMGIENPWVDLPQTTDFVAIAKGLGIAGERIADPRDIDAALQRALAAPDSYLIDVATDPDTRIKRAVKGVVPIISDRKPAQGASRHISPPLKGSWPN